MINFIEKKEKKKYLYIILLVVGATLLLSGSYFLKSRRIESPIILEHEEIDEIEENNGFKIILPSREIYKEKNIKVLEYRQKDNYLTILLQGEDLEDIRSFNQVFFKDLKISEIEKKEAYQVKNEGFIKELPPLAKDNQDLNHLKEDYEESFFLKSDFSMMELDLLRYEKKDNRLEISLQGNIEKLLTCFRDFPKGKKYENLDFTIEDKDKNLYLLTFKASL